MRTLLRPGWLVLAVAPVLAAWITIVHAQPIRVSRGDIVSIRLQPIPEGPGLSAAEEELAREEIRESIPIPLPHPAWNIFCEFGGNMIIELRNGDEVSYGPCRRPASINHLWAVLIDFRTGGKCRPNCGPGGEPGP